QVMLTRQELGELLDYRAGGTIARVPADPVRTAGIARHEPTDIIVDNIDVGYRALAFFPVAVRRHLAELLDILAKERAVLKHHLEAVILGGVMAAGYLDAAIHLEHRLGII